MSVSGLSGSNNNLTAYDLSASSFADNVFSNDDDVTTKKDKRKFEKIDSSFISSGETRKAQKIFEDDFSGEEEAFLVGEEVDPNEDIPVLPSVSHEEINESLSFILAEAIDDKEVAEIESNRTIQSDKRLNALIKIIIDLLDEYQNACFFTGFVLKFDPDNISFTLDENSVSLDFALDFRNSHVETTLSKKLESHVSPFRSTSKLKHAYKKYSKDVAIYLFAEILNKYIVQYGAKYNDQQKKKIGELIEALKGVKSNGRISKFVISKEILTRASEEMNNSMHPVSTEISCPTVETSVSNKDVPHFKQLINETIKWLDTLGKHVRTPFVTKYDPENIVLTRRQPDLSIKFACSDPVKVSVKLEALIGRFRLKGMNQNKFSRHVVPYLISKIIEKFLITTDKNFSDNINYLTNKLTALANSEPKRGPKASPIKAAKKILKKALNKLDQN